MMIDMNGVVYALTYALDCIEGELVGVSEAHAKWAAYLSILLGRDMGFDTAQLSDLAACAALHVPPLLKSRLKYEENGSIDLKRWRTDWFRWNAALNGEE